MNEVQEIAIMATCVMYVLLFIWNMRTMRKFRKSGGPLGQDKSEGIFEDKLISCAACCLEKGTKLATNQLDKEDAKKAVK